MMAEQEALDEARERAGSDVNPDAIEMRASGPFNKESFRRLIKRTYDDFHPNEYNLTNFDIEELMKVVADEKLEAKYAVYLDRSEMNMLDLRNMPWLDLGDLPSSYNSSVEEAYQVFIEPLDELPNFLVIPYSDWSDKYDSKRAKKYYDRTALASKGV